MRAGHQQLDVHRARFHGGSAARRREVGIYDFIDDVLPSSSSNKNYFTFKSRFVTPSIFSDSISLLLSSGVKVTMITGDAQETAEAIAERLGFFDRTQHWY